MKDTAHHIAAVRSGASRLFAAAASLGLLALISGCSTVELVGGAPTDDVSLASLSAEAREQREAALARRPTVAALRAAYRRPAALPAGALASPAVLALGEKLYNSKELSKGRGLSCASCHMRDAAWADLVTKPIADNGFPMRRRTQTLYDVAWSSAFLWDGTFDSLEGMVRGPIASPDIMGLSLDEMVDRLKGKPDFVAAFGAAYSDGGVTPESVSDALAAYMRTLRSPPTRFDRWVAGADKALSPAELRGFQLFNGKANCVTCHSTWRFTDDGFRDIGLRASLSDPGRGRQKPQIAVMAFAFKTPTLRGVAERPPYMHDGSIKTLEAVVEHYDRGGARRPSLSPDMFPLGLDAQEKSDLVAFMRALSPGPGASRAENAAETEQVR